MSSTRVAERTKLLENIYHTMPDDDVIATHHAAFDLTVLADSADLIIDTRNAMANTATNPGQVVKA